MIIEVPGSTEGEEEDDRAHETEYGENIKHCSEKVGEHVDAGEYSKGVVDNN